MLEQLRKLKQFLSISTGLISFSYFNSYAYAINLGAMSPDDSDGKVLNQRLEEIANNYTNLSSMFLNLDLTATNTEETTPQERNNSAALTSLVSDIDESSSTQTSNYLTILIGELTESKTGINSGTELIFVEEPEFSARNLFGYIAHSLKKLNINQSINLNRVPEIAILPQVDTEDIYKGVYDFSITTNKKYDLNSSLNNVFNNNQDFNNQASKVLGGGNNSNSYVGLQHQLVNSVQVRTNRGSSSDLFSNGSYTFSGGNFSEPSNNWVQYFDKGQQYSNFGGLVGPASGSYVNRQLQLQQQLQRKMPKRKSFGRR